jgi:RNA polymerase sigma-70 factor (ECF subfamily)
LDEVIDERVLLAHLGGGDDAAFWSLWRAHRPHLFEICHRFVNDADAEDAVSRAMLIARAKLPRYANEIINLEAWLTRLAGNVCRDILREQRRGAAHWATEAEDALAELVDSGRSAEDEYLIGEIRVALAAAIDSLPARLGPAAVFYFIDELPYPTVAERLDITIENARKRIQQARALLREALAPYFTG